MLFLDILQVDAYTGSGSYSTSVTINIYPSSVSNGKSFSESTSFEGILSFSGSGSTVNGSNTDYTTYSGSGRLTDTTIPITGSYSSVNNTYQFSGEFPLFIDCGDYSQWGKYVAVNLYGSNISPSVGSMGTSYITLDDSVRTISRYYDKQSLLWFNGSTDRILLQPLYHFNWTYANTSNDLSSISVTFNISTNWDVYDISQETFSSSADVVTDPELTESSKAIEESVTSDTGGGLLATIKSWFGSFFDNLIGVFVPEDGYFSDWFDRVNTLLSEKLGMLYAPFDLLISTLQAIYDSDDTENGIPFPGIKWEASWLVEPTTFYFSSLGDSEGVTKLRDTVYFGTDVVLLFSFLFLLERKIKHILED